MIQLNNKPKLNIIKILSSVIVNFFILLIRWSVLVAITLLYFLPQIVLLIYALYYYFKVGQSFLLRLLVIVSMVTKQIIAKWALLSSKILILIVLDDILLCFKIHWGLLRFISYNYLLLLVKNWYQFSDTIT